MGTKKLAKTEVVLQSDENGEQIASIQTNTFIAESEPQYVKLYIQDIGKLNNISGKSNEVLFEFIKLMSYNNMILAYKPVKQMIARSLNISLHTVDKSVKEFKKKGLFISVARGIYMADPKLFGKGKWSDIKNLRLIIDYNDDGTKKIKSNLPEQIQLKLGL